MNRYAFLLLSIFPVLLGAASCSTDPIEVIPVQRERTIKSLANMCREKIIKNHTHTVAAVARLSASYPAEAAQLSAMCVNAGCYIQ